MTDSLDQYLEPEALGALIGLIFLPSQTTVRTLEYVDLTSEPPTRQTIREYDVNVSHVLIPVAFPRREQLIDRLAIEGTAEVSPYALARVHTITVMQSILIEIARSINLGQVDLQDVLPVCNAIPALDTATGMGLVSQLRQVFERYQAGGVSDEQVVLINAMQYFARRQPLLIPTRPASVLLKLTHSRDFSQLEMQHRGFREGGRAAFGRAPDAMRFDCALATRSQSYHFRLRAPNDYFIRQVRTMRKLRAGIRYDQRNIWANYVALDAPTGMISGAVPSPTELLHLQCVNLSHHAPARHGLVLFVRIAERPLGHTGSALARLLLVLLSAILLRVFGPNLVSSGSTAVSSVLLAAPSLLGAALIASRSGGRVREPLLARVGSAVAVALAIALTFIFGQWLVDATRFSVAHPKSVPHAFAEPGGVSTALTVVMSVSIVSMGYLSVAAARNVGRYLGALRTYRRNFARGG